MSDTVILREMEMMERWTGKSGNEHIEFWLKTKHLEEICWWGYLIYRTKIPQCYTFWMDKMMIFMHAAHVIAPDTWWVPQIGLCSHLAVYNGSDFFTGHLPAALPASPPKRPLPSVRIEIRVTQLLYSALFSVGWTQRTSVGMKKLAVLYCWAYFPVLLAFRLFLRSLQPILAAAQAFRLDLIQRILPRKLQPPWNSFERLDSWRISHRKFHISLCSSPGFKCGALIFIIGKASMATLGRRVSGLHMILWEVPQLIWTMAHCQGLHCFAMAEQTGTKRSAIEAYFAIYGIKHIAFCCSGCVNTQPANPELKFLSERTVGCRSSSWRPHFHATLASVQNG